jgi:hypothetical protein
MRAISEQISHSQRRNGDYTRIEVTSNSDAMNRGQAGRMGDSQLERKEKFGLCGY